MRTLRRHVAVAIDGGGIRGTIAACALAVLEEHLGRPVYDTFELAAGTSTGSIISVAIAAGIDAQRIHALYCTLGSTVFGKSLRSALWLLTRYRYTHRPLEATLRAHIGDATMADLWARESPIDVVIPVFDVVTNHTCFIKPWKTKYAHWPVVKAVLASCSVPTYFPAVDGRYVDGGVGSYTNPCYLAAYELSRCLRWDPAETTLISLGTGRAPHKVASGQANRFWAWEWLEPLLGAFLQSADDQQVHLVDTFFTTLDFRRFQVDLRAPIAMDDPTQIDALTAYGDELGNKLLNDETDPILDIAVEALL